MFTVYCRNVLMYTDSGIQRQILSLNYHKLERKISLLNGQDSILLVFNIDLQTPKQIPLTCRLEMVLDELTFTDFGKLILIEDYDINLHPSEV